MELYNFFTEQVSDKGLLKSILPELKEVCHFVHIVEWPVNMINENTTERYSIIGQMYGDDTNVGDTDLLAIFSGINYTWFNAFGPTDNNLSKEEQKISAVLTDDILISLGARKEIERFHDETGDEIYNSNSYYFKLDTANIHVRHFFKEPNFIIWIKYNFKGYTNLKSEDLKFYENQFIKKCEKITEDEFKRLVEALTNEQLHKKLKR